jgi:hypothetical protein
VFFRVFQLLVEKSVMSLAKVAEGTHEGLQAAAPPHPPAEARSHGRGHKAGQPLMQGVPITPRVH